MIKRMAKAHKIPNAAYASPSDVPPDSLSESWAFIGDIFTAMIHNKQNTICSFFIIIDNMLD